MRYRREGDPEVRWSRVKASPVRDPDGGVRLAINVIEDITEIKRSEEAQRFLAESGRILARSLDYEETLAAVARLAVPEIADWCAVDVLGDDGVQRLAVAHVDPAKRALAHEVARRYPVDPNAETGVPAVLQERPVGAVRATSRTSCWCRPRRTRSTSSCCARSACGRR